MSDECQPPASIQIDLLNLDSKLQRLMDGIETVKDKQEFMAEDVSKIKEAVYNPDEGIYARLRELEAWKKTQSKLSWIFITTFIGITGAILLNFLVEKT